MKEKILCFIIFAICFVCALNAVTKFSAILWGISAGIWLSNFIIDFFK